MPATCHAARCNALRGTTIAYESSSNERMPVDRQHRKERSRMYIGGGLLVLIIIIILLIILF